MQKLRKVLVSGCLGGAKIRFDSSGVEIDHPIWRRWEEEGRIHHFCPEIAAGFPVPRPPAEIKDGTASDVVEGRARVFQDNGTDVTAMFLKGAKMAVETAVQQGVAVAVLTDGSPSCGTTFQYSGNFDGRTEPGRGVVAEMLVRAGIKVFPHTDLEAADNYIREMGS